MGKWSTWSELQGTPSTFWG